MNPLLLSLPLLLGVIVGAGVIWLVLRGHLAAAKAEGRLESEQQLQTEMTLRIQAETRLGVVEELQDRLAQSERRATEREVERDTARGETAVFQARAAELAAELQARMEAGEGLQKRLDQAMAGIQERDTALGTLWKENANLYARIATLETESEARECAFEEARKRLQETFQANASQALQANSEAFLQLARTTLQQIQAEGKGDLEARQTAIATLMEPLQQGLSAMDQQLRTLQEARAVGEAQLTAQLQALTENQKNLQGETGRLANALRKPQVRGRWGELQLQNLVELAGMKEHVDFTTQSHVQVDGDRRRPDMLVKMPGGKCVAVDAKTPLGAYLDALEAATEEEKQNQLAKLPALIRTHVAQLADKRYYEGLVQSPDFVVLFLHGEGPFALACEKDPTLLEEALRKGVLLATPVTLMALLKSAAFGWQQQRIQDNAEQIRATAAELIKRFAAMTGHITDVREGLGKALGSYNAFAGSLERMVIPQARRIQALGVQAYKKKGELIDFPAMEPLHEELRAVDVELLTPFEEAATLSSETEA